MTDVPPTGVTPANSQQQDGMIPVLIILWYVYSGLTLLGSCFGGLYIAIGIFAFNDPSMFQDSDPNAPPPEFFGWMFAVMGGGIMLVTLLFSLLSFLCARKLSNRRSRTFCMVASTIVCINIPLGTALGVLTLISLTKPEMRRQFEENT